MLRGAYVISPATAWQPFFPWDAAWLNEQLRICVLRVFLWGLVVPFHPSVMCIISLIP